MFLARTDNEEDLRYLDRLVESADGYSRRNLTEYNGDASKVTYGQAWDVVERGTMYIKIDDDIVSCYLSSCTGSVLKYVALTFITIRCSSKKMPLLR